MDSPRARAYLLELGLPQILNGLVRDVLDAQPSDVHEYLQDYFLNLEPEGGGLHSHKAMKGAFTRRRKINWKAIAAKLPVDKTPEQNRKRAQMFQGFDPNGNGYLSLAEVDKGIRDVLGIQDLFDCKPAIMRAFQAAKRIHPSPFALSQDYITRCEFRMLLVYLKKYFELFVLFDLIDSSEDRRLSLDEFVAATSKLQSWGVIVYYPEEQFKALDKNGGGMVLFEEFAEWAISLHMDAQDINFEDDVAPIASTGGKAKGRYLDRQQNKGNEIDFKLIASRCPTSRSAVDNAKRNEMFRLFDPNGNGYLSLAEVDKGLRDVLRLDTVFDAKPAIMRAWQAAKGVSTTGKARLAADYVTRSEFRVLLIYLQRYFELYVMFDTIASQGESRFGFEEFKAALPKLAQWGIKVDDPQAEFQAIDVNGGGKILFNEFCDWAIKRNLSMGVYD